MFQCGKRIFKIHIFIRNEVVQEIFFILQFQSLLAIGNCFFRISEVGIVFGTAHEIIRVLHRIFLKFFDNFFGFGIVFKFEQNLQFFRFDFQSIRMKIQSEIYGLLSITDVSKFKVIDDNLFELLRIKVKLLVVFDHLFELFHKFIFKKFFQSLYL